MDNAKLIHILKIIFSSLNINRNGTDTWNISKDQLTKNNKTLDFLSKEIRKYLFYSRHDSGRVSTQEQVNHLLTKSNLQVSFQNEEKVAYIIQNLRANSLRAMLIETWSVKANKSLYHLQNL